MPLPRVLEPEVMDTEEEASDYDAMDHGGVNATFADDLVGTLAERRDPGRGPLSVLDVGTGTALIPIALASRLPQATLVAVDLADHMLRVARANVERAGLGGRITLERHDAKSLQSMSASFHVVMSNSIIHHIADPAPALASMWQHTASHGLLFVRDLARPRDEAHLAGLVDTYARIPTGVDAATALRHERQRHLFRASLHAALSPDEVLDAAVRAGIVGARVTMTSDRHWTLIADKA
jgi:ubiquinone/menaquinone biosynthesis C-methylase UbiE